MMKSLCLSILLSAPLAVWAADATPDSSFYKNAAEAGISEVDAGNLASEKATDPKVKDFGAMMVKDHSAANAKLKAIATSKGVDLPDGPSLMQKAKNEKTDLKSGDSFDHDYIKGQIKAHKETIDLLQKEISSGQDAEAKAFATATLPKVKAHLDKISKIAADAGIQD